MHKLMYFIVYILLVLSHVKVEGEDSKEFAVRVSIHQGSVLLPFIFAVVMDVNTEEVAKDLPICMQMI